MLARDVYHCDPDDLLTRLSAEKFAEWQVIYSEEALGPGAHRAQMAQLLAGVHNGGRFVPRNSDRWTAEDFHPTAWEANDAPEPDAPASAPTLDQIRASARAAGMEV